MLHVQQISMLQVDAKMLTQNPQENQEGSLLASPCL